MPPRRLLWGLNEMMHEEYGALGGHWIKRYQLYSLRSRFLFPCDILRYADLLSLIPELSALPLSDFWGRDELFFKGFSKILDNVSIHSLPRRRGHWVVQSIRSGGRWSEFTCWSFHLIAMRLWVSYLISSFLSFPIYEVGILFVPKLPYRAVMRNQYMRND